MKINRYTETVIKQRATPNLVNEAAAQYAGSGFGAAAKIAGAGAEYSKKLEDAETRTWVNKAIIEAQREAYMRSDKIKTDPNAQYKGFADSFKPEFSKYTNEYAKSAPSEEARQAYMEAMNEVDLQVYKENKSWENRRTIEVGAENIKLASKDLSDLAYRNKVQGKSNADLYNQADATTLSGIDIYSTEQLTQLNKEIYQGIEQAELNAMLDTNPEELVRETTIGRYSPGDIDADKAINEIMRLEGGFVEDDAGKGPTLYGINSEANPDDYKEIKALYDAGMTSEAQERAKETYKKKYWDAIGADSLPPELRLVAFDAAVNQGQNAAKQMIKQSGGDAGKFTSIRKSRYLKLASSDPSKAQFLDAWLARTDETSRAAKGSDLPPSLLIKYRKKGEEAYKKIRLKNMAETMRFMPMDSMIDTAIKSGEETLVKQAQKYQEELIKDPAGYVSAHPDVQLLSAKLETAQNDAEATRIIQDRNSMMLDIQNEMGVPGYRQSVVPAKAAEETAYAMMDVNSSPDDVLKMFDDYSAQFAGFESDAIGQLKQNGMKDTPLSALLSMPATADRIGFVKAIRAAGENKKMFETADVNLLESNVKTKMEKIVPAITHLPNYQSEVSAYNDGISAMAMQYMAGGMDRKAAVDKATEEVFGKAYKVIDKTLLVPAGVSDKGMRKFLSRQERFIKNTEILVPENVPEESRKDYINDVAQKAEPRTIGTYVMFFDYMGLPILEKNKVKYDAAGNITNAYDAALRFNVYDAAAMGDGF
jgi:hypothetical protein